MKQSLSYYPNYVSWIRLKGDLEFRKFSKKKNCFPRFKKNFNLFFEGNENYEAAISSYITAIVTGSEYCTVHLHRQIDDYIIRRMIKCATNLGCYMQAYILCQVIKLLLCAQHTFEAKKTFNEIKIFPCYSSWRKSITV